MAAPSQSRLQFSLPQPGDAVPKYRYMFLPVMTGGWAANLVGAGTSDPIVGEVSGQTGIRFQTDNDTHNWMVFLPDDVDVEAPIDFRYFWSSDQTTTADSYTWAILYTEIALNGTTAVAEGASALSTAIAADTNVVTSNALQASEWGTLNGGTLTGTAVDGYAHAITLQATSNGGTVASDLIIAYGVQIRYMPKKV